jgi:hypothetical protein
MESPAPTTPEQVRAELHRLDGHLRDVEQDLDREWRSVVEGMEGKGWGTIGYLGEHRFPALRSALEWVELSSIGAFAFAPLDRDGVAVEASTIPLPGHALSVPRLTILAAFAHAIHDVGRRVRAERLRLRATWMAHVRAAASPSIPDSFEGLDDFDEVSRTRDRRVRATFSRHALRFAGELCVLAAVIALVTWGATNGS